jgi:hypothetical protein
MLANALFYVVLLAICAMTFLSVGLTMTRMTATRVAETYLAVGYERALSALQEAVAAQIQTSGLANPLPTFTPLPALCADGGNACAYETSATIAFPASSPVPMSSCDPSQNSCATNQQANAYINEGRVPARITVRVTTRDGTRLAMRTTDVLLRTIASPPYALIGGGRDGSFGDIASSQAQGDDGGTPPATPNPCGTLTPGIADDTAIRVAYENAVTNACSDGSAWRSSSYTLSGASPSGWSP